jgi:hypothetical protein
MARLGVFEPFFDPGRVQNEAWVIINHSFVRETLSCVLLQIFSQTYFSLIQKENPNLTLYVLLE